jgi:hypothetical protein
MLIVANAAEGTPKLTSTRDYIRSPTTSVCTPALFDDYIRMCYLSTYSTGQV